MGLDFIKVLAVLLPRKAEVPPELCIKLFVYVLIYFRINMWFLGQHELLSSRGHCLFVSNCAGVVRGIF